MSRTSRAGDPLTTAAPWRRSRLRRAGLDARAAAAIADDPRYDVDAIVALVERGCPPPLALRIVAPLDGDPR
jgi:hypothetical protein